MNTVFARLAAFPILLAMSALMGCNKGTTPAPPNTTTTTTTTPTTTTTTFPGQCLTYSDPFGSDIYGNATQFLDWVYQPCGFSATRVDILKGVLHSGTGDSAVFSGKNDFTPAEENQIFLALTSIDQDVLVKSGLHTIAPVWVFDGSYPNGSVVNSVPNVIALCVTVLSADRVTDPNLGSKITAFINQMASANKPSSTNANEPSSISASPAASSASRVSEVKAGASQSLPLLRASGTRYVGNSPTDYRPLADILADPKIDWAQPGVNPTDTHAVKAVPRSLLEDSSNNTR